MNNALLMGLWSAPVELGAVPAVLAAVGLVLPVVERVRIADKRMWTPVPAPARTPAPAPAH